MELIDYWSALVRGWWLILVFGLIGLAVPLLLAPPPPGHIETHYQTVSKIGSPPTSDNGPSFLGGGITIAQILYYANTDKVVNETSQLAGLPTATVQGQVSVVDPAASTDSGSSNSDQNGVVNVTTTGATPEASLALNKAFVQAMNDQTNSTAQAALLGEEKATESTLQTVLSDIATNNFVPGLTAQALEVQVTALQNYLASLVIQQAGSGLQVAQAPTAATTSAVVTGTPTVVQNRTLRAVAGLLLGLLVGALAAIALWFLDRRLKTSKRAQTALGYPVVAEIPFEATESSETYRMLWLSVFREPLPLPPVDESEQWYGGEDPLLDRGVATRAGQAGRP